MDVIRNDGDTVLELEAGMAKVAYMNAAVTTVRLVCCDAWTYVRFGCRNRSNRQTDHHVQLCRAIAQRVKGLQVTG